ncbi:MAG TPA: hypothetical protein VJB34_04770 [Bdellovibrionota bacterium]|nr:hypothetical protein [Bdellovibrionota bacterium]
MFRLLTLSVLVCTFVFSIKGFCDSDDPWENLQRLHIDSREPFFLNATFTDDDVATALLESDGTIFFRIKSGGYGTSSVLTTRGRHDFHIILNHYGRPQTFHHWHGTHKIFEPSHPAITKTVRFDLHNPHRVIFLDKGVTGFGRSMALVAIDLNYAGIFEESKFLILLVNDRGRSIPVAIGETDLEGWSDRDGNIRQSCFTKNDYKLILGGNIKAQVDAESFEFISADTLTSWTDVERFAGGLLQEAHFNIPEPTTPQARMLQGVMQREKFRPQYSQAVQALITGESTVTTVPTLKKLKMMNTESEGADFWENGEAPRSEKVREPLRQIRRLFHHSLAFPKANKPPYLILSKSGSLFDLIVAALSGSSYFTTVPTHLPIVFVPAELGSDDAIQQDIETLKGWIRNEGIYLIIDKTHYYALRFLGPHQGDFFESQVLASCSASNGKPEGKKTRKKPASSQDGTLELPPLSKKKIKDAMQDGVRRARKASGIDRGEGRGRDTDRQRGEEGKGPRWRGERPPRPPRSGR